MKLKYKKIIIIMFALRAVSDVFLAFASPSYMPLYAKMVSLIVYATVPLGILYVMHNNQVSWKNLLLLFLPLEYWFFLIIHTRGGYEGDWITSLFAISCFLLMKDSDKCKIFDAFYWIVQINNIISLFMYVCYMLRIDIGFSTVLYYSDNAATNGYFYQKWGIFAICSNGMSDRLCGIFNEPGGLGTICALLLIVRFKNSKLWERLLLIITTLCTLSMAGYILMFLFAAFYAVRKNWKNILWAFIIFVAFLAIPKIDWGNDVLNAFASRFEITETGLSGDNRTTREFDKKFNEFINSADAWFGMGAGYSLASRSSTYKFYIVEFGIVGFALLIASWVYFAIKTEKRNPDCLIFIILFMLSLYQRPNNLRSIYGYVILFGGVEWIKSQVGSIAIADKQSNIDGRLKKTVKIRLVSR